MLKKIIKYLFIFILLSSCANYKTKKEFEPPEVYISSPVDGGLVRRQSKKIINYSESGGMICFTEKGFQGLLEYILENEN